MKPTKLDNLPTLPMIAVSPSCMHELKGLPTEHYELSAQGKQEAVKKAQAAVMQASKLAEEAVLLAKQGKELESQGVTNPKESSRAIARLNLSKDASKDVSTYVSLHRGTDGAAAYLTGTQNLNVLQRLKLQMHWHGKEVAPNTMLVASTKELKELLLHPLAAGDIKRSSIGLDI